MRAGPRSMEGSVLGGSAAIRFKAAESTEGSALIAGTRYSRKMESEKLAADPADPMLTRSLAAKHEQTKQSHRGWPELCARTGAAATSVLLPVGPPRPGVDAECTNLLVWRMPGCPFGSVHVGKAVNHAPQPSLAVFCKMSPELRPDRSVFPGWDALPAEDRALELLSPPSIRAASHELRTAFVPIPQSRQPCGLSVPCSGRLLDSVGVSTVHRDLITILQTRFPDEVVLCEFDARLVGARAAAPWQVEGTDDTPLQAKSDIEWPA